MLPKIIGITGKARAGKDTIASIIANYIGKEHVMITGFAHPLKSFCKVIFGWSDEHMYGKLKDEIDPTWDIAPRLALQTLGTDWGRKLNDDVWVRYGLNRAIDALEIPVLTNVGKGAMKGSFCFKIKKMVIFTDVRFPNEARAISELGINGRLIKIIRPKVEIKEGSQHESETSMDSDEMLGYINHFVNNDDTKSNLKKNIEEIIQRWEEGE